MAKSNRNTDTKAPVDAEDDDRRLNPQVDAQPLQSTAEPSAEPSAAGDEHRGLAARLLDLRKLVEEQRQAHLREHAQVLQRAANVEQQVVAIGTRVDKEIEGISRMQRDLEAQLRESAEQVRKAGELARKMTDQLQVLAELREMAADPHEVVKPLRASLAVLRGDLEALGRTIDIRFEALPKERARPLESRSDDESPVVKLGNEIRELRRRLRALEPD